ncbi:MAG: hypothetical protein R3E13_11160 [Alphaproteobacteria bacterium]
MAYRRSDIFNQASGAAAQPSTSPVQSLLSHVSNVTVKAVATPHGLDATKQLSRGQITEARNSIKASVQENKNVLAAVERDADVVKREVDAAGKAAGHGGGGAFERTPNMAGSEGGLLMNALSGGIVPIAGKGSMATAVNKALNAMDAGEQIKTVLDDRKASDPEKQGEIADILVRSSSPETGAGGFGLITQVNTGPRIDVVNDYAGIMDDYGLEGLKELYNLDVDNPSSAFSELQEIHAANAQMEVQLAELDTFDEMLNQDPRSAAGVDNREFPRGFPLDVENSDVSINIASLDAVNRDALRSDNPNYTSASRDLENELIRQAAARAAAFSMNGSMA